MISFRRILRLNALVLGAGLVLAGCDAGRSSSGVTAPHVQADLTHGQIISLIKRLQPENGATTGAVIDANGGVVTLHGHSIVVGPGAVSEPTLFAIVVPPGDRVAVDLFAWRVSDWSPVTTFSGQVQLILSYKESQVDDASKLVISYLQDGTLDGALVPLVSVVNTLNQTVTATLQHFSGYALATD